MVRPIVTLPNPILTTPTRPVVIFNKGLKQLVDDMVETMRKAPGVGLAAPQIGVNKQIIVIEYNPDAEHDQRIKIPLTILINPKIVHYSQQKETQNEGCLSIPKVEVPVTRSKKIKLIAQTLEGEKVKINTSGFFARILQHEVDHINGVLITDRVTTTKILEK